MSRPGSKHQINKGVDKSGYAMGFPKVRGGGVGDSPAAGRGTGALWEVLVCVECAPSLSRLFSNLPSLLVASALLRRCFPPLSPPLPFSKSGRILATDIIPFAEARAIVLKVSARVMTTAVGTAVGTAV